MDAVKLRFFVGKKLVFIFCFVILLIVSGIERQEQVEDPVYKMVAKAILHKRQGEALSENDAFVLGYYGPGGLMGDNRYSNFRNRVLAEVARLSNPYTIKTIELDRGTRIPLFTETELAKAKYHRRRSHKEPNHDTQPSLIYKSNTGDETPFVGLTEQDPTKKVFEAGRLLDAKFGRHSDQVYIDETKEIRTKRKELRERINLPIVHKGDKHVDDKFYKFLVKYIVRWDIFGIFRENLSHGFVSTNEFEYKVNDIGNLINDVLDPYSKNYKQYKCFDKFVEDKSDGWGIDMNLFTSLRRQIY